MEKYDKYIENTFISFKHSLNILSLFTEENLHSEDSNK